MTKSENRPSATSDGNCAISEKNFVLCMSEDNCRPKDAGAHDLAGQRGWQPGFRAS